MKDINCVQNFRRKWSTLDLIEKNDPRSDIILTRIFHNESHVLRLKLQPKVNHGLYRCISLPCSRCFERRKGKRSSGAWRRPPSTRSPRGRRPWPWSRRSWRKPSTPSTASCPRTWGSWAKRRYSSPPSSPSWTTWAGRWSISLVRELDPGEGVTRVRRNQRFTFSLLTLFFPTKKLRSLLNSLRWIVTFKRKSFQTS